MGHLEGTFQKYHEKYHRTSIALPVPPLSPNAIIELGAAKALKGLNIMRANAIAAILSESEKLLT